MAAAVTPRARAAVVLACLALAGCGGGDEGGSEGAREADGAGVPTIVPGPAEYEAGRDALSGAGCLGCHRIAGFGNAGPGPDLSRIGARMTSGEIARTLVNPRAPMPSYSRFRRERPAEFRELVRYLAALR